MAEVSICATYNTIDAFSTSYLFLKYSPFDTTQSNLPSLHSHISSGVSQISEYYVSHSHWGSQESFEMEQEDFLYFQQACKGNILLDLQNTLKANPCSVTFLSNSS